MSGGALRQQRLIWLSCFDGEARHLLLAVFLTAFPESLLPFAEPLRRVSNDSYRQPWSMGKKMQRYQAPGRVCFKGLSCVYDVDLEYRLVSSKGPQFRKRPFWLVGLAC